MCSFIEEAQLHHIGVVSQENFCSVVEHNVLSLMMMELVIGMGFQSLLGYG